MPGSIKSTIYKISFALVPLLFTVAILCPHLARADITSNLQMWFKFDEGSGTTAIDSSGNSNTGTLQGAAAYVTGKIGPYALSSNGSNGNGLSFSSPPGLAGTWTWASWVYITSYRSNAFEDLFSNGPAAGLWTRNGAVDFCCSGAGGLSAGSIPLNTWTHVVVTYNSGTVNFYFNGALDANTYTSVPGFSPNGSLCDGGTGGECLAGSLDDERFYFRVLSQADITELYSYGSPPAVPPWAMSSASFFLHSLALPLGGGSPTYSFSTSTSFKVVGAAGETAVGTSSSSSFQVQSGFMRNLYKGPAPIYTQTHYHWRNDDGSETTATSMTSGAQDTPISSVAKLSTDRLRIEVSNEGGTILGYSPQAFRLEYGLKSSTCAAISSWTDVGDTGGDWDMIGSANLTEGADTTDIAVSTGGVADENHTFISPNAGVKDVSSQVASTSVPSDSFIELEYSIEPLSAATDGGAYCFRVTSSGSSLDYVYSQYPQATLANGGSLTFSVDGSSEAFPFVTPGTLSATTSILTVATGNSSGFNISIQRSDVTGTMSQGSTYIPDKTDWLAPNATTTAGNATASTTQPLTLQFRVRSDGTDAPNYASAWWGADDTTPNALFGGVSSTTQQIIDRSTAAVSTTTAYVQYDLNVPVSQPTGSYSGSIIYTVTANP